ncbi:aldose epimerase family protein [Microvirga sp. 17 mud 1-3]|uniref:aldose epimerase family protein n=1 Tax=Microvirga sp. 17 mud 1-3 TaxID=2082949 RepID=UPI000D6CBC64|nr:aldose epimerase family protein [Microvirga sp. 17 mud 1-3]AWM88559.1 galactose-1-epimerase [Microvirga sp. 17 mud 1-3]
MAIDHFGTLDGRDVWEITLTGPDGMELRVLTWGAVIRDLIVPARQGPQPVVLGLNSIADYKAHSPYFGAIVGRYANRIGQARFTLDGHEYTLDANEGRNQLHGGTDGFGTRHWTIVEQQRSSVTLSLVSDDGDMGYPGRLVATCTYSLLPDATVRIVLEATCDQPTPVNLTTHGYFNLDGSLDICSHHLTIAADYVTPTASDLIPTGEIRRVAATPYDFRNQRPIGAAELLRERTVYDINYVLRGPWGTLRHAATLQSLTSGLAMELWTTEPGVQFYDGHMLEIPVPGLNGAHYGPHAGLCLEPQRFPDGPNNAHFPSCILGPGSVSRQISELRFASV